jgi:hypothetical protein
MIDDEFRHELRALFAEDNRRRAEHSEFLAERKALASPPARKTDAAGVMYRDFEGDALAAASAVEAEASEEEPYFTEQQCDCLADVLNEIREEFDDRIERTQQRILQTVTRLILPGELAEREVHDLRARVIRAEEKIERQLKAAMTDDDNDNIIDLPDFISKRNDNNAA